MDRKQELRAEITRLVVAGIKATVDRDVAECVAVCLLMSAALNEYIPLLDEGPHKDNMWVLRDGNERLLSKFSEAI